MKKYLLLALFYFCGLSAFSQINLQDSTVQTIAYWDLNEKNTYQFLMESFEIAGNDTTTNSSISYKVDMSIVDSTETGYEFVWKYYDFEFEINREDSLYYEFSKKMLSISSGSKVQIKTNEYGVFQEVTNWEEIQSFYKSASDTLKSMFSNIPQINAVIDQTFGIYMTKNSIESQSILDVYQFLNFHGASYKLGEEVSATIKTNNVLGKDRLERNITVLLDEIFAEDNDYRIISYSEADPDQLKAELKLVFEKMLPNASEPEIQNLMDQTGDLTNTIENVSIIHGWGWPIYSREERITSSAQKTKVEVRTLELL